ncbi:MAG TPA: DUF6326 family protein [Candidatus Limnocylindrales bacterium]
MHTEVVGTRARLSAAWVFVLLNMLFADILSFMSPGALQQVLAGTAEGIQVTPGFLLVAAVVAEVPIAMVLLSLVLPQRTARWANIAAAAVTVVYVLGLGSATPHYVFIAALETLGCLAIATWSWTWRPAAQRVATATLATD